MAQNVFPTKGNLIATRKSLQLARLGYDLMDRKRNILVRELMLLVDKASEIQGEIEQTYIQAYKALQNANVTLGICDSLSKMSEIENGIALHYRSVMGVDIPTLSFNSTMKKEGYGIFRTNSQLDIAYISFNRAKELTVVLAEVENSVYRLANAIKTTQRRANALKNINIPNFEETERFITAALEEKEREEFSRLKVIRNTKEQNKKYKVKHK